MSLPATELAAIRRLPLFADVPLRVVSRLLRGARLRHFDASSVLFREGDASDLLYLALDARICLQASDGRPEYVIEFVPPGEPFILAAVILDKPFLVTARVVHAGTVLSIPAADLRRAAHDSGALSHALNESASVQWRALSGRSRVSKCDKGPQRLAAFLASLAEGKSGAVTIELPCERQILAA